MAVRAIYVVDSGGYGLEQDPANPFRFMVRVYGLVMGNARGDLDVPAGQQPRFECVVGPIDVELSQVEAAIAQGVKNYLLSKNVPFGGGQSDTVKQVS